MSHISKGGIFFFPGAVFSAEAPTNAELRKKNL